MDMEFAVDVFIGLMADRGWGPTDVWKAAIRKGYDISEPSVRAWAAHRHSPQLPNIRMLADVFEVDVAIFFASASPLTVRPDNIGPQTHETKRG